ncbi:MAG: hypothetical protein ACERKD_07235 [Prolixibacteraceae bacterium]
MNKLKPECNSKCNACLFFYANGCIASPGENCFKEINRQQAQLILNNPKRFSMTLSTSQLLKSKFPTIVESIDSST